ncbi:MAG: hypothetical protein ACRDP6_42590 [Actinoallomurus sp.]
MSGETPAPPGRERFNRENYEQELSGFREALKGARASVPTTAVELYELERLVKKYPDHARQLLPPSTPPPT